jgi:hypothetical protein
LCAVCALHVRVRWCDDVACGERAQPGGTGADASAVCAEGGERTPPLEPQPSGPVAGQLSQRSRLDSPPRGSLVLTAHRTRHTAHAVSPHTRTYDDLIAMC